MSKHNTTITAQTVAQIYDIYLNGEVGSPSNYVDWCELLNNAAEEDTIRIHINSYGGRVHTAVQLMNAIRNTRACVVTSMEGQCYSAATLIFLAGDIFEAAPHSAFLAHDYSNGVYGEGHKLAAQIEFDKSWFEAIARDIYRNFLSEDEISKVLKGQDLWLNSEQVIERCVVMQEARITEHRNQ